MNLGFDPSVVTELLKRVFSELREKRLWPVAVALLVAIVAVPVALSKSSSSTPVAQVPQPTPAPSAGTTLPALNVQTTPSQSRLTGRARNPFTQQGGGKKSTTGATATATATAATSSAIAAVHSASAATTGSSQVSSSGSTLPSSSSAAPPPRQITPPNATPTSSPAALTATQAYHVTLAITNSAGGLDTIDPLKRLTILPSEQQPLLVELGVLQGAHRVLFVVQPGTTVNGPGTCTPGPIDCEVLSLAQDQTEGVSVQSPSGVVPIALFAVTGIAAQQYPSAGAADKVRRIASAPGSALLDASTLSSLSLFHYEPSLGALVDLRNLTVTGGS